MTISNNKNRAVPINTVIIKLADKYHTTKPDVFGTKVIANNIREKKVVKNVINFFGINKLSIK